MTQTKADALELERTIKAPPAKVLAALTDPVVLAAWFAPGPMTASVRRLEARPGGRYEIAMTGPNPDGGHGTHTCAGTFSEVGPDRVVMTFNWVEAPLPEETLLIFELHPVPGGTRLVLRHEGLPSDEAAQMHTQGWEGCLAKLADIV